MCTAVILGGLLGYILVCVGRRVYAWVRGISQEIDALDPQIEDLIAPEHRDDLPFRISKGG